MSIRFGGVIAGCWLAGVLALPSCSGKDSGSGKSSPVPEEQLWDRFAEVTCNGIAACCERQGMPADEAACRLNYRLLADEAEMPDPNLTTYDPVAAGQCLEAFRVALASCEGLFGFEEEPEACDRVWTGSLPLGAACQGEEECAPNAQGDVTCDFDVGICVLEVRGAAGDGCHQTCARENGYPSCYGWALSTADLDDSNTVTSCWTEDGLYCAADGTCQALLEIGDPCGMDGFCVEGAVCDDFSGVCEVLPGVGESCRFDCERGAYCSSDNVCEALKPDGAPCDDWDQCLGYCDVDTRNCVGAGPERGGVTVELCASGLYEEID
jgi:hypothetical protein